MKSEYIPKPKRYRVNHTKGYNQKRPPGKEEKHSLQGGTPGPKKFTTRVKKWDRYNKKLERVYRNNDY